MVTSPSGKDVRFAVGTDFVGSTSGSYEWSPVELEIITQNSPTNDKARFGFDYDLGEEKTVSTTLSPESTTKEFGPVRVTFFVVAVDENKAADQMDKVMIPDLEQLATDHLCTLRYTSITSCRIECHMSSDPERGCISVTVALNNACEYSVEELKSDVDTLYLDSWAKLFSADRIDMDDCLASIQYQWYITIAAAMVFTVLTFLFGFCTHKMLQIKKDMTPFKKLNPDPVLQSQVSSQSSRYAYRNAAYPFEIVNEEMDC